jgi:hypothetical protein
MSADYRKLALQDLAAFCQGIIPTEVASCPTTQDGIDLAKDLSLLAAKVDAVIASYGDYAQSTLGVSKRDMDLFNNQTIGALEGNALYIIESAANEQEEERRTPDPDEAYDRMRDEQAERGL